MWTAGSSNKRATPLLQEELEVDSLALAGHTTEHAMDEIHGGFA
jgi:hypothetical protein